MPEIVNPMSTSGLFLFNAVLLLGICVAVVGIRWVGKDNKRLEERVKAMRQARHDRHAKA